MGDFMSNEKKAASVLRFVGVGMSFGVTVGVYIWFLGLFLGRRLDARWGTEPWLMLLGIMLGIGLSFWSLLRQLKLLEQMEEKRKNDKG